MIEKSISSVFRIVTNDEYNKFKNSGLYEGNCIDKESGFIHLSNKNQLHGSIKKYFADEEEASCIQALGVLSQMGVNMVKVQE